MASFGSLVGRLNGGMVRYGVGRRLCPAGGCATGSLRDRELRDGQLCTGRGSCLCCPKITFCIEKPPKICFKCVCSKPLCDPCTIEGNGYFPTCWRPFAYPPNYSHCPVPPPGVLASQAPPLTGRDRTSDHAGTKPRRYLAAAAEDGQPLSRSLNG